MFPRVNAVISFHSWRWKSGENSNNIPLKTTEHIAQSTLLWTYNHEAQNWLMVQISAVTNFFSKVENFFQQLFQHLIFLYIAMVILLMSILWMCEIPLNSNVDETSEMQKLKRSLCVSSKKTQAEPKRKSFEASQRARSRLQVSLNFKFYSHYLLGCKTRRARSRYCCSQVSSTGLNFKFYCHYPQGSSTELRCWTKRARARYCCSQGSLTVQL